MPFFSIVVAARDAASTLPDTIESVQQQTFADWEAVIVDDGSQDETLGRAGGYAAHDARIRILSNGSPRGVSAARNIGIHAARGEWLLFLDADDSLFPDALSAWHRGIQADRYVDAMCGRWVRVAANGGVVLREHWPVTRDMFPVFARLSAFPINSCTVRRALVLDAVGFDATFVTCEDWDLWQRLARAGASFGSIDDEVARYHMRRGSASLAARQMLADGLRVIDTGHTRDPRVAAPVPQYENGLQGDDTAALRYAYACWPAALVLGSGDDAVPLLDEVGREPAPAIDPSVAAEALFRAAPLPLCTGADGWIQLWPEVSPRLLQFLDALDRRTGARLLSRRILVALGRLILESLPVNAPLTRVAHTTLHAVDVRQALQPLTPPADVERVVVRVCAGSEQLGFVHLPVCDGQVDAAVIADTIAFEYGWTILRLFFESGVYREVVRRARKGATEAVRHGVVLGQACDQGDWAVRRHDLVGWTVFLQELWGRPDLAAGTFYDPDAPERASTRTLDGDWITVDVLDPPVDWTGTFTAVNVELSIAGRPVCALNVAANGQMIRSSRLRALLTTGGGVELVHVAVREGLIGRPWEGATLREHLSRQRLVTEASNRDIPLKNVLASPSARACAAAMVAAEPALAIVGARKFGPPGAATSRRASLPSSAYGDVIESAEAAGEPVVRPPRSGDPERVAYVPELIWDDAQRPLHVARDVPPEREAAPRPPFANSDVFGRHHFESLFASKPDPWRYTTPYEARKYEHTLSLIGAGSIARALEIGCAEGHFTEMLAPRVRMLLAADISAIAIERAAGRCAGSSNVSFARLDLVRDALPGDNDLIVCSEVLYYIGNADGLTEVARKLRDALRDGGRLVTAHANIASDDPAGAGFRWEFPFGLRTIRDVLSKTPGLQLTRELQTTLYSVLEFERSDDPRQPIIIAADFEMPEATVAATICWEGGAAPLAPPSAGATLPILVYHRIADRGAGAATSRYRVAPADFVRQLAYLRDAGFRSASLAEWTQAILTRRPLAGRSVALTFDDAYVDFIEVAWPLLRRHGLGATLFVVSAHAGGENAWDRTTGETVRLMDWSALRRAARDGVEIGAHSATHCPMTGLEPVQVVREASRARADIQRQIDAPVTAFAYPYGDFDAVVEHLIGGCGFVTGVTSRAGSSTLPDRPLRLPRIEITGSDSFNEFIRKVGGR